MSDTTRPPLRSQACGEKKGQIIRRGENQDARRTYGERFGASARSSTPWKHPEDGDEIWRVEQTREERTASASAHLPGPQRRGWLEDGVKSGTRLEVEVVAKRKTLVIFVNSLKCVSVLTPLPLLNDDDSHHLCPPASLRPSPPLLYADDSHHLCPPDPPPRTPLHLSPACPERIGARQRCVGFGGTVLLTPRWDLRHIPPRTPPPVLSTPALERVGARPRLVGPNAWARGGVASGLCSDTASRKLADASCATPLNLSPPCRERVGAQRLALGLCQDTPCPKTLPPPFPLLSSPSAAEHVASPLDIFLAYPAASEAARPRTRRRAAPLRRHFGKAFTL
ncbi:hypothetical protein B0H19DRAFT_1253855 [Mycena capillaripes]|nr:hypothetical protein B0H19DRAFT_1253855 [Mycena capillaripes]